MHIISQLMVLILFLSVEHPFDVVMTDFIGLWGLRDADLFGYYKCRIRVLDSFGTEPLCMHVCVVCMSILRVHNMYTGVCFINKCFNVF